MIFTLFPSFEAPEIVSLTVSVTYEAALDTVSMIVPCVVVLVAEDLKERNKRMISSEEI